MAIDYARYLDVPVEDIEAPKPLPTGTYYATISKWETREVDYKQGKGKTPVVTLTFRMTGATDDVEPDALPEGGGVGRIGTKDYDLNDPEARGQYQLRRLGEETCQLPVKGLHLGDLLRELVNQEVKVFVDPPKLDGEGNPSSFVRIARVLSVHEKAAAEPTRRSRAAA